MTKKTVFKWQERFWKKMQDVFNTHYAPQFKKAGLVDEGGLNHLISDSATMQVMRWRKGGFGMAAHNYGAWVRSDDQRGINVIKDPLRLAPSSSSVPPCVVLLPPRHPPILTSPPSLPLPMSSLSLLVVVLLASSSSSPRHPQTATC